MIGFITTQYLLFTLIGKTQPDFSKRKIAEILLLSNKYAIVYNIPVDIFVSIMAQESRFDLTKVNHKTQDHGIAQINIRNIRKKKINKKKLTTDLDYSIMRGAETLSWFKEKFGNEREWWVRYNCGTGKSCPKWQSSKQYIKKIKGNLK